MHGPLDDLGKEPKMVEIPAEMKDQVKEARALMVEKIAELDDELTTKFLEGQEISVDELKAALRKGVIAVKAAPDVGRFGPDARAHQRRIIVGQMHEAGETATQSDRVDDREADAPGGQRAPPASGSNRG